MQKFFALVMVLVLLVTGTAFASQDDSAETAMQHLVYDWLNYQILQERTLVQQKVTLEQILRFGETKSWEDLIRARTMSLFTIDLLEYLATQTVETQTTSDEYALMTALNMDVSSLESEILLYNSTCAETLSNDIDSWKGSFLGTLMETAFHRYITEDVMAHAEANLELIEAQMVYFFYVNNYILCQLPETTAAWAVDLLNENIPGIMTIEPELLTDTNEIQNRVSNSVNNYEKALTSLSVVIAQGELTLETFDIADNQELVNLPTAWPLPQIWLTENSDIYYYWKNEDGQVKVIEYAQTPDEIPDHANYIFYGATLDDFLAYVEDLSDLNIKPIEINDTAALYKLKDGTTVLLSYNDTDGSMGISVSGGQLCLALEAYLPH